MPKFICPVDRCNFHKNGNCKKKNVISHAQSLDYDVGLICPYQSFSKAEKKEKKDRGW